MEGEIQPNVDCYIQFKFNHNSEFRLRNEHSQSNIILKVFEHTKGTLITDYMIPININNV